MRNHKKTVCLGIAAVAIPLLLTVGCSSQQQTATATTTKESSAAAQAMGKQRAADLEKAYQAKMMQGRR